MLKLKKLQILGFKSFCDRTELQFSGTGVVAIVGPNGCGKSNIADAISWVLGEQSAKSLRGGRMEDVIFAGTRDRMATGMAEVSLTLIDPAEYEPGPEPAAEEIEPAGTESWDDADSALNGSTTPEASAAAGTGVVLTFRKRRKVQPHNRRGEIVVTRRLFRNGESDYLMNGRPCRLRDIQELFMGTGLGPESYAIIEQGRIGQILSSKPHERRAIIEEAAGVGKYKAKRRMAEARLEAARQNLARINDIFEEVTRQVNSLKRQASKAQRYRQLKIEFDARHRALLRGRGRALAVAQEHAAAAQAAARVEVEAAQRALTAEDAVRAAAADAGSSREIELRRATADAARLLREREHAQQQAEFAAREQTEVSRRVEDLRADQLRSLEQNNALATELEAARREREAASSVLAAAASQMDARRSELAQAQAAVSAIQHQVEAARQAGLQALAQSSALAQQQAQQEARGSELARQLERLEREAADTHAELDRAGARRGQLQLEFQTQQSAAAQISEQATALAERARELAAEQAGELEAAQNARTQAAEAGARRASLEEISAQHGYSSDAVRGLLAGSAAEGLSPKGLLGEYLEVEAPFDRALEQFLHEELNYVVVESWTDAQAGLDLLHAREQGRATLLVRGDAPPPRTDLPGGWRAAAAAEEGVIPALAKIRALQGFKLDAALPRLRDTFLVTDAASSQARVLAERYPSAYFLTLRGECYHHCLVSAGAGASRGPLSLKRELREWTGRESALQSALARHEQRQLVLTRDLEAVQLQLEQSRAAQHEAEKGRLTSSQAVEQAAADLARAQARLQQLQLEADQARAACRAAAEAAAAAAEQRAAIDIERARLEAQAAAAQEQASAAGADRDSAAAALGEAQAEQARLDERARAAAAAFGRIERMSSELMLRRQQTETEIAKLDARSADLAQAVRDSAERSLRLAGEGAAAQAAQAAAESALELARVDAAAVEARMAERRATLDRCRELAQECELALARLDSDAAHLAHTCQEELACPLADLLAEPEAPLAEGEMALEAEALEECVRTLRQRIEALGPVNMMALEEFEEAQQRHTFMDAQRKDLLDSIADTHKAIQEMDAISRQKFEEAFERINTYFQETFRILFGGGQGFLRLSEIEGASEHGVDLVAQPPGKKLQNALLLSGGEKAMTAMALLIAVFRYQPSPFCLLDEVDAPMDEANTARFAEMVKQMSAQTQFILITHSKRTMESAPTLYGVTMAQAGVSRLVSVRVEDAADVPAPAPEQRLAAAQ
ncbi:MAG TPA: chromosome segregation protein SMC [Terriglobales bacterium]|nr:chromosome segregation protein SMC [Terriglobales bacterium]